MTDTCPAPIMGLWIPILAALGGFILGVAFDRYLRNRK